MFNLLDLRFISEVIFFNKGKGMKILTEIKGGGGKFSLFRIPEFRGNERK